METLPETGQELLAQEVLQAQIQEWLLFLLVWAAVAVALVLLKRLLVWRFAASARKTTTALDDALLEVVRRTTLLFLIVLALYLAALFGLPEEPREWMGAITFLVFLLQVVWWGNSLISLWITGYKERKLATDAAAVTTVQAMGFLGRLVLYSIVLLLALDNLGIDVTALIAGLGVGGIAVALAVQNILGDLFASLSIVLDKPFVVGDFLIIGEFLGAVEHIGLKTTRIRSLGGEQIIFSNSDLLNSRIRNYKRMFERRVVFGIGVVYQTPHEQLAAIPGVLREIVEAQDHVRFDRAHFKEFGDYALKYEIVYYVLAPDYNVYMDIQQAINLGIYERFEREGIEFAYPTQRLFLQGRGAEEPDGEA